MIQPYDTDGTRGTDAHHTHETGPVFADPSGQRRRLMRALGAAASVLLVAALIVAGIGLFGGPDTPFSVFGSSAAHQGTTGHGDKGTGPAPGSASSLPPGAHSGSPARSGKPSPSPSTSRHRSPTPTPSSSPTPTNKAGRTPPGQGRSKQPHPSPSSSHGM